MKAPTNLWWRSLATPFAVAVIVSQFMIGCESANQGTDAFRGVNAAERYAEGDRGRRIDRVRTPSPLTINGETIEWGELLPALAEAAGGLVVEEITLERLLAREVSRRGLTVTSHDQDLERNWLLSTISGGRATPEAEASRLISEVRGRRGLGPVRFASLLRRNALLRALVRDRVEVLPHQVELAWRVRHGERVRVRVIIAPNQRQAQRLRDEALAGDPDRTELRFSALAEAHSTDASASRGGLIEPFSTEDPAYEQSVRQSASALQPGHIGPIVPVRNGYAVLYLDQRLPADGTTLDDASEVLTEDLRRRQERLLMDQLATQLLAEARVNVTDDSLSWSVRSGSDR